MTGTPAYTLTNFNTVVDSPTYKAQIDANFAVLNTLGAWFAPSPSSPAAMTVKVNAGALFVSGAIVAQAVQTTGTITAPSGSNKRIDRVVIDATTGAISVITGTPTTGTPTVPAITSGKLPCCTIGSVASPLLSSTTSIGASLINDERTGGGSSGKLAQMVNTETGALATGTTQIPDDDTIPQNTEGDQYLSLAITPQNSSSTLLIDVVFIGTASTPGVLTVALFQDSTASALAAGQEDTANAGNMRIVAYRHKMTAGTTSSTTFKVRAGLNGAATTTFNGSAGSRSLGGVMASSITITEILP